jgi:hypothetical protein
MLGQTSDTWLMIDMYSLTRIFLSKNISGWNLEKIVFWNFPEFFTSPSLYLFFSASSLLLSIPVSFFGGNLNFPLTPYKVSKMLCCQKRAKQKPKAHEEQPLLILIVNIWV